MQNTTNIKVDTEHYPEAFLSALDPHNTAP
jgi:hypothetical protein